ncbi:hypothetical protein G3I31_32885 [Streptomyces sp. SID9913]|uniref:hypothetical protein n=1 Tax=unclassified Streptomyces TaxID=2593676 RepID=UPI0013DD7706|nr:hypothetical protein [Streptomyces sp. SID9913]NED22774.1 hypothetical protein [Streptomyces sp. SID9913]
MTDPLPGREPRLLPWSGVGDKPCYLITDDADGPVTRLADTTESVQLDMGTDVLAHARALIPDALPGELRHLAECLTTALADALRVAESRGRRLRRLT